MWTGTAYAAQWDFAGPGKCQLIATEVVEKNVNNNLVEGWYSLEQYIGLKEDKLSSTTVDFIRSEGKLKTKHLYWIRKPKKC